MTACEIAVQGSVDDLPTTSQLSDSLSWLRREAQDLHKDVAKAVAELRETLWKARSTGYTLQNAPLFSNPATAVVGGSIIFTVDMVLPRVDDVSDMVATVFEAFDIAAGGAGNPDRIAAIAEHLQVEVSAKLVEFADAMSYSRLATPGKWDSPAADNYYYRADTQTTDGLRPVAEILRDIAHSLETYADSQVEYANEVGKLWIKIFWLMVSLLALVLGGIKTAAGFLGSSGGAAVFKAAELAGWVATFISFVSAWAAFNAIQRDIDRTLELPHPACELLEQQLAAASYGVDIAWPRFTTDS